MLTRSPIAPHASKASPSSFHYAPHAAHRSPHHSPAARTAVSGAASRRPSTTASPSAPAAGYLLNSSSMLTGQQHPPPTQQLQDQPQLRQYVGVDVATQYSPMETFDYSAPRRPTADVAAAASSSQYQKQHQPPLDPAPHSILPASSVPPPPADKEEASPPRPHRPPEPSLEAKRQPAAASYDPAGPAQPPPKISPTKRRSSHDGGAGASSSSAAAAGPSASTAVASSSSASVAGTATTSLAKRPKTTEGPPKVLPRAYEHCDVEDMVVLIANMLGELIETNDAPALRSGHLTRFHSRTSPGISVLDYLHRLAKHATLSPPLLLSMVYYIDRLCLLYPEFTINTLTVHRFLITAATVAAKGLSDSFWTNSLYARVGGVKVAELKLLELEFLYRVDWKIVPNPEVLVAYYRGLVERCPGYVLQGEGGAGGGAGAGGWEEDVDLDDDDDEVDDDSEEDSAGNTQGDIAGSVAGVLAGNRPDQGGG